MSSHLSDKALTWAIDYFTSKKIPILNQKRMIETSYSEVHQIETTQGVFYLKQVPEALFLEPNMLAFLYDQGCQNTPKLIAKNSTAHCFLMCSCGDISLRHFFKEQVNINLLKQGIINYTNIQRALEHKTKPLLKMGVLDWRLNQFPSLYYKLLRQEQLLIDDGLTRQEIEKLNQLYPACAQLCEDLADYTLPETISHCDFHENNMLLDQKTGAINIIDWGEVVLTHPFLSLSGCLWNINYFHNLSQAQIEQLKLQCVTPWLDCHNTHDLLYLLNITNRLNGIHAALTYEQMYCATQDKPNSVQQERKGSIAGCLRAFYNSMG